ncbi:hypothetical protein CVT26_005783 [Gymnopilus dilepis]|uniref:Integrase core domain-containing protein n=1 Tax=Gymnopilus dilepis TaxID=231916 RepID=A0A409WBN4_9AGAR|nr:hypothetical protein CVT26_005783 [Gymnopilus dilepis]
MASPPPWDAFAACKNPNCPHGPCSNFFPVKLQEGQPIDGQHPFGLRCICGCHGNQHAYNVSAHASMPSTPPEATAGNATGASFASTARARKAKLQEAFMSSPNAFDPAKGMYADTIQKLSSSLADKRKRRNTVSSPPASKKAKPTTTKPAKMITLNAVLVPDTPAIDHSPKGYPSPDKEGINLLFLNGYVRALEFPADADSTVIDSALKGQFTPLFAASDFPGAVQALNGWRLLGESAGRKQKVLRPVNGMIGPDIPYSQINLASHKNHSTYKSLKKFFYFTFQKGAPGIPLGNFNPESSDIEATMGDTEQPPDPKHSWTGNDAENFMSRQEGREIILSLDLLGDENAVEIYKGFRHFPVISFLDSNQAMLVEQTPVHRLFRMIVNVTAPCKGHEWWPRDPVDDYTLIIKEVCELDRKFSDLCKKDDIKTELLTFGLFVETFVQSANEAVLDSRLPTVLGPHGLHPVIFFLQKFTHVIYMLNSHKVCTLDFDESFHFLNIGNELANTLARRITVFLGNVPRILFDPFSVRMLKLELIQLEKKTFLRVASRDDEPALFHARLQDQDYESMKELLHGYLGHHMQGDRMKEEMLLTGIHGLDGFLERIVEYVLDTLPMSSPHYKDILFLVEACCLGLRHLAEQRLKRDSNKPRREDARTSTDIPQGHPSSGTGYNTRSHTKANDDSDDENDDSDKTPPPVSEAFQSERRKTSYPQADPGHRRERASAAEPLQPEDQQPPKDDARLDTLARTKDGITLLKKLLQLLPHPDKARRLTWDQVKVRRTAHSIWMKDLVRFIMPRDESDSVHQFLMNSDKLVQEARFIISSIPNVDIASVERSLRQLHATVAILVALEDPALSARDINDLVGLVNNLIIQLEEFRDRPPLPRNFGVSTEAPNGRRGRPRYQINLDRAKELHDLGNSWDAVATALGVGRKTLGRHFGYAGLSAERAPYTDIDDEALDEHIADISLQHPMAGSSIMDGHLKSRGVVVPRIRIQESLQRVDAIGVMLSLRSSRIRWYAAIRRRVYKVRGSNALWHQDGNEKLRPWGFYVHGCVDGHSRLVIYMICSNNKKSATVGKCFRDAVAKYGWPSRVRGDFGSENNEIERLMWAKRGQLHRPYLRGRSIHNIRIERLWRDVRKDSLEFFRRIFLFLEDNGLLDMEEPLHRIALFLVYQPRIQQSLNETVQSWNLHKIRTAGNKSPLAMYELSREQAIREGYWTGDPGDSVDQVDDFYGTEYAPGIVPPAAELASDPEAPRPDTFASDEEAHKAGIFVNHDDELRQARENLGDIDLEADDGQNGIGLFCEVLLRLVACSGSD